MLLDNLCVIPPQSNSFPIVCIGASAGGLEALTSLLEELPPDTGLAFVIIQHLDPLHKSLLPDLLARSTKMPVRQVRDGMRVEINRVYVIPTNASLTMSGGVLRLTPRETSARLRLPIDGFLRSLAENCRNKAIAVILSGTGADGSLGLESIKAEGGITFAQDVKSAKFGDMPKNAAATDCVDFVLAPGEIAQELARMARHSYVIHPDTPATEESTDQISEDFSELFELLRRETKTDFSLYRQTTIARRIHRRQALHNMETLDDYVGYVRETPLEIHALYQDLLIKVTQFFRDPEAFDALKSKVFPQLLQKRLGNAPVRLWVSGCATGEEAYSLAICLSESIEQLNSDLSIQVFASDINPVVIERARKGSYPENIAADITSKRLQRYFTRTDQGYQINEEIRELCVFAGHDLLKDPPYSRMDLICCRNVLIYMGSALKRIVSMFHGALKPAGYLMLGTSESADSFPGLFAVTDKKYKIYSKKESPQRFLYNPSLEREVARDGVGQMSGIVHDKDGPARVVLDRHLDVMEIGGDVEPYLDVSAGRGNGNLLNMVRGAELSVGLHATLENAKEKGVPIRKERLAVEQGDESRNVNIEVIPLSSNRSFLVFFDEIPLAEPLLIPANAVEETLSQEQRAVRERDLVIREMQKELTQAKLYLSSVIERQGSSGDDAQSAQDEAQSNIEELQSINEELESAKEELQSGNEELQSTNEELKTVSEELQIANVALGHSRDFSLSIVETIRIPLLVLDTELRVKAANQAFYRFFRASSESTEGRPIYDIGDGGWNNPELRRLLGDVLPNHKFFTDFELERKFPEIGDKTLLLSAHQLDRMQMILLSMNDITARKSAEKALRGSEERLRQAQKMEAIGRLAGGVAHDFNNLLTGILGYSELLLDGAIYDSQKEGLQEIKKAADRAASLTRQLLTFSRRQVLQPKVLLLNSIVADMERMLRRLIGEHIELSIGSDEPLESVLADPGQISQVIMNLALNARDAMLIGGKLTIETRNADLDETAAAEQNIEPGQYVVLAVSDTGVGIDADAQSHLFEPFFTTKDKALGTGLGLATVYGIVEQSGAKIRFSSELGRGTSFRIFFRHVAERAQQSVVPQGSLATVPRGSEVILLVEDEQTVRRLTRTFLESKGYTVLDARHGNEGLALCRSHLGIIHLLLTDVLMPEMSGRELAEQAMRLRPEMKVLFISGYTNDVIGGMTEAQGAPFLQKPFALLDLGQKVRELLDSTAEA